MKDDMFFPGLFIGMLITLAVILLIVCSHVPQDRATKKMCVYAFQHAHSTTDTLDIVKHTPLCADTLSS